MVRSKGKCEIGVDLEGRFRYDFGILRMIKGVLGVEDLEKWGFYVFLGDRGFWLKKLDWLNGDRSLCYRIWRI